MLFSNTPEFIGRYQVVKELKSGGMGTVFLARDPRIGRHMGGRFIAIKVLQEFDDVELRARFEREADIAGTLDHRNIVQIYDRDEFDGRPFIVMEFVDGRTLSELIDTGTVPLIRKLQWMEELCDGLACAHNAGVVHRDIKPANIMIRALDGVLKILDFGIARANTIKVGMTRGILGTLNYMAPEQWDSTGTVDSRADAFAAGAVFYELLSGEKAFPGNDVPSIYRQISSHPPQPLEKLHPNLDADLIAIVNRCLEKRPADRYADMVAVRADLAVIRQRLAARDAAVTLVRPARTFVNEAQRAIEQGDFTLALKAVEQALLMEPDNTAARDLEQRARSAIQVENWLRDARGAFERGALTAASMLVDQILTVNESHPDALSIRLEIETVRHELERARQIETALGRARESLDAGELGQASAACAELLEIDPENADAASLRQRLEAATAERRIAQENARAQGAVAEARRQFAAGQHADAVTLLERHQPAHATVTAALAELRAEHQEIERRREEAERRRQEEEQRRQEEQRQIAAANERARVAVTEARRLFNEGNHPAALQLLEAHHPQHWDVTAALETLRDKVAELERQRIEEEQRKNEAEQRKKEEERQRAEAERRKQDQERLEAERRKQQQEQAEAERRKQQQEQLDAQRRKEEADARQRLAAERQKQEEARVEADRRKAEAQRHLEAQKRAAEQTRRDEESRRQAQAAAAPAQRTVGGGELTVKLKATDEPQLEKILTRPSDAIKPAGEPRAVDWRILATAAAVVMAVAIVGVMKWRSGSSDVPASGPSSAAGDPQPTTPAASSPVAPPASSSAATPPPATPASPRPEPSPAPTASAPVTPAGPPGSAAIDSQVAALRATAQEQWARDNRDQAMTSLASALKLKPRDPEASRLASGFIRQMSERASNAATAARNAGAPDTAGSAFDDARRRVRDAAAAERAGKPDQSVRAYGDALDLFAKAIATANVADGGRATPPTPTVPLSGTGATGSASPAGGTSAAGGVTPSPPAVVRPTAPAPVVEASPPAAPPPAAPPTPVPVVPAQPPPPPTVTAATRAAAEESAVRLVLQRYNNAYESLQAASVQAVYPGIDARRLQDVFNLYKSLKRDLEIDRVEVEGQTATATGTVTSAPVVKTGKAAPQKSKALFRLKKSGDTWLIQDVSLR